MAPAASTIVRSHAALTLLAVALSAGGARAEERADADVNVRYTAIESALARGESSYRLWWNGWTLGFAGLTAAQGTVLLLANDEGTRIDAAVGATGSLLGLGGMLLSSRTPISARRALAEMDASTPAARALRLQRAESLLEEAADAELFQRSIWAQLGAATVTLSGTFVLWLGYARYSSGWLNLLAGTAISELQILSMPTDAIGAWDDYRAGRLRVSAVRSPSYVMVSPVPGGLGVSGAF